MDLKLDLSTRLYRAFSTLPVIGAAPNNFLNKKDSLLFTIIPLTSADFGASLCKVFVN